VSTRGRDCKVRSVARKTRFTLPRMLPAPIRLPQMGSAPPQIGPRPRIDWWSCAALRIGPYTFAAA
jgi:hypothetical protein